MHLGIVNIYLESKKLEAYFKTWHKGLFTCTILLA